MYWVIIRLLNTKLEFIRRNCIAALLSKFPSLNKEIKRTRIGNWIFTTMLQQGVYYHRSQTLLFMGSNVIYGQYQLCTHICPATCSVCYACKAWKKCLKWRKSILFDCFNLFGHFKGLTTGIIIHGSPPWTMGMLVQYHTNLSWSLKLCKFMQYT